MGMGRPAPSFPIWEKFPLFPDFLKGLRPFFSQHVPPCHIVTSHIFLRTANARSHSLHFHMKGKRCEIKICSTNFNFDSCYLSVFALLMQSSMRKSQMQDCGNNLEKIRLIPGQYLWLGSSSGTIKSLILANQLIGACAYLVPVLVYNHICIELSLNADKNMCIVIC